MNLVAILNGFFAHHFSFVIVYFNESIGCNYKQQ